MGWMDFKGTTNTVSNLCLFTITVQNLQNSWTIYNTVYSTKESHFNFQQFWYNSSEQIMKNPSLTRILVAAGYSNLVTEEKESQPRVLNRLRQVNHHSHITLHSLSLQAKLLLAWPLPCHCHFTLLPEVTHAKSQAHAWVVPIKWCSYFKKSFVTWKGKIV